MMGRTHGKFEQERFALQCAQRARLQRHRTITELVSSLAARCPGLAWKLATIPTLALYDQLPWGSTPQG